MIFEIGVIFYSDTIELFFMQFIYRQYILLYKVYRMLATIQQKQETIACNMVQPFFKGGDHTWTRGGYMQTMCNFTNYPPPVSMYGGDGQLIFSIPQPELTGQRKTVNC